MKAERALPSRSKKLGLTRLFRLGLRLGLRLDVGGRLDLDGGVDIGLDIDVKVGLDGRLGPHRRGCHPAAGRSLVGSSLEIGAPAAQRHEPSATDHDQDDGSDDDEQYRFHWLPAYKGLQRVGGGRLSLAADPRRPVVASADVAQAVGLTHAVELLGAVHDQ